MAVRSHARERIAVRVSEYASAKQHRGLGAFERYCILRVEREFGEHEAWIVNIAPLMGQSSCAAVHDDDAAVEDQGTERDEHDGALAVWDVMCRIEQRLREYRR